MTRGGRCQLVIRSVDDGEGHSLITVSLLARWLREGVLGAASRHGYPGLQCRRAGYCPAGLRTNADCRSGADAITFIDVASAQRNPDAKADENGQAAASDLGAGVDQQEVRRS